MEGISYINQSAGKTLSHHEPTCKLCGGFLSFVKCDNWNLDLFGKEARFDVSSNLFNLEALSKEQRESLISLTHHKRPCKLYGKEFKASEDITHCEECDTLLPRTADNNPCSDCLKNEPDTILKRFNQSDKDALKTELGYALDDKEYTVVEDVRALYGEAWQGYTLELLGIVIGRFSECQIPNEGIEFYEKIGAITRTSENRILLKPSLLFPFTCIPCCEDPDLIIKLCRIRASYEGSPLYSEMRAHPYGVRRVSIHGLECAHVKKDLERAVRGLDLLRKVDKRIRGRKPGAKKYNEQRFRKVSVAEYRKLLGEFSEDGKLPTIDDLAFTMRIDRSTFIRYGSDYNFSIEQIRSEAISPQ